MSIKILSNISHPDSLSLAAVEELKAQTGARKFEHQILVNNAPVTVRNYQAIVEHFDSVWRGLFK